MSLSEWEKNGWLKPHKTSKQEIDGLISIFERCLKDSEVKGISTDAKFTHAFRAALTLATALLRASGYNPVGQGHHYRTIDALPLILGKDFKDDAHYLDACRVKRNAADYDSANEVSESEAKELHDFVVEFGQTAKKWIKGKGF